METYKGGFKGCWGRRAYHRLDGAGGSSRRRRSWRIKIAPRMRIRILRLVSPKRWLAKIRDAYVRLTLGFASSAHLGAGFGYGFGGEVAAFGRPKSKEYEERMLVEIYKSIIAHGPFVGADAAQIAIRR
ncbi:uncharacterized protein [Typha angustifolia]|uniref:uncharacterized protein n=1 Tax=Typha angustifolia TaxID=59011 RepID=UPI003C2D3F66